jgi:hypothetical protein
MFRPPHGRPEGGLWQSNTVMRDPVKDVYMSCQILPLFYSFVRGFPEGGHVEAETCRMHIVKDKGLLFIVQLLDQMLYKLSVARNMENIKLDFDKLILNPLLHVKH